MSTGYRIGDGDFAPWYGERETNEGGEFAVGAALPFWKDRVIDKRRAEIFKAQIKQQMADQKSAKHTSSLLSKRLMPIGIGSLRYKAKSSIASSCALQWNAMTLFAKGIKAGFIAEVEQIDNRPLDCQS